MLKESLKGKVVLVTGAAGGISRWGICPVLVELGVRLAVTDIADQQGVELVARLNRGGEDHRYYHLDTRKIGTFQTLIDRVWEDFGRIDILINNAGINLGQNFLDLTPEGWDEVHNTNLRGHIFLSQLVVRKMIKAKMAGVVLFVSSIHQEVCGKCLPYSTSKAGIVMAIKEMAVELGPHGIRVVGVAPGGIYTDEEVTDRSKSSRSGTVPLGERNGIPNDVGNAVAFLVSGLASHITGEILIVSGGQYLNPTKPH